MEQPVFNRDNAEKTGVELEGYVYENGVIVPRGPEIVEAINDPELASCELPACQIEIKTLPCKVKNLKWYLYGGRAILQDAAERLGLSYSFDAIAPADIPLEISPDKRHQDIAKKLSHEKLLAGSRVASTQFHFGMRDKEEALKVYNFLIQHCYYLISLGDISKGRRLNLYGRVYPDFMPRAYHDWYELYRDACDRNFANDIRNWWDMIRITRFGTIELRMFDSTPDIERILHWNRVCFHFVKEALNS
ncbi:hypothetical protein HOD96_01475 [Candidatus Falkowbacteria bacterium]|nr:hypothetical protein [Candidatus Falkowbacteria bacterium]MBT4433404.1 hypothetical protein [Candidatus Falkowbacteria bacterium]